MRSTLFSWRLRCPFQWVDWHLHGCYYESSCGWRFWGLCTNQGRAPAHPGSRCVNIPHPVHTCHLTVLLIKQKLLNHSPRAYIFLIFCVAKGSSHNVRPLHTAAWWWVWRKNIRFTSLELQRELVAFMVEHYFFSCKKYKKKFKKPTDYCYLNDLVSRKFPVNE